MNTKWFPVIEVLLDEEQKHVAARMIQTFNSDTAGVSNMLFIILNMIVNQIPEEKQELFKKRVVELLNTRVINKYEHN
jgi:hypothetical protein